MPRALRFYRGEVVTVRQLADFLLRMTGGFSGSFEDFQPEPPDITPRNPSRVSQMFHRNESFVKIKNIFCENE